MPDETSVLRTLGKWINRILSKSLGIRLERARPNKRKEQVSFPLNPNNKTQQFAKLAGHLKVLFAQIGLDVSESGIQKDIFLFDTIFRECPISSLSGGMGYNNGLFCFCLIRAIQPDKVIESGVWRGYSTYLIDKSTSEKSSILSFDINLSLIEWRSSKASYHNYDLSEYDKPINGKILALFDDHVSHFDRIKYCHDKNIEFIILDDDVSVETVHSDGCPPIPTANMLVNYEQIPHRFSWISNGRKGQADISKLDTEFINRNYQYLRAPDFFEHTGYRNSSSTSIMVRRKSN
tara:strand:+ start:1133 stop:2008 length:876 start_codon:yes stop_codon:yes gene_type:complete